MGFSPVDDAPEWVPRTRQDGRRFIVTGSNRGIGYATALGLAALGGHVTLAGHESRESFTEAMDSIALATGCDRSHLEYRALDLSSLASVRAFARDWDGAELHGLINNAGVAGVAGRTGDGFEMCFEINYLAMFLLTRLLLPSLRAAQNADGAWDPARIVCVSSSAHLFTLGLPTDESYVRGEGTGFFSLRYGESKLCVNAFVKTLASRLAGRTDRESVVVCAVHPGSTGSGFWASFPVWAQNLIKSVTQDPARGARTSLFCATEVVESGAYYAECAKAAQSFWLGNEEKVDLLWRKSCAWTGVSPNSLFPKTQ